MLVIVLLAVLAVPNETRSRRLESFERETIGKDDGRAGYDDDRRDDPYDGHYEDGTAPGPYDDDHDGRYHDNPYYEDDDEEMDLIGWLLFGGFFLGGQASAIRMDPETPAEGSRADLIRRQPGESLLPFARLDTRLGQVDGDILSTQLLGELGWGPLALVVDWTHLDEDNASDLDVGYLHGVYRMSVGSFAELGVGLGVGQLNGVETTRAFSVSVPLRVRIWRYFGVEYRPSFTTFPGSTLSDHQLSLRGGIEHVSLLLGYRFLRSGDLSLSGPNLGITLSY